MSLQNCAQEKCNSRGTCIYDAGWTLRCNCEANWTGENCETEDYDMKPINKSVGERLIEEPFWIGIIVVLGVIVITGSVVFIRKKCSVHFHCDCCDIICWCCAKKCNSPSEEEDKDLSSAVTRTFQPHIHELEDFQQERPAKRTFPSISIHVDESSSGRPSASNNSPIAEVHNYNQTSINPSTETASDDEIAQNTRARSQSFDGRIMSCQLSPRRQNSTTDTANMNVLFTDRLRVPDGSVRLTKCSSLESLSRLRKQVRDSQKQTLNATDLAHDSRFSVSLPNDCVNKADLLPTTLSLDELQRKRTGTHSNKHSPRATPSRHRRVNSSQRRKDFINSVRKSKNVSQNCSSGNYSSGSQYGSHCSCNCHSPERVHNSSSTSSRSSRSVKLSSYDNYSLSVDYADTRKHSYQTCNCRRCLEKDESGYRSAGHSSRSDHKSRRHHRHHHHHHRSYHQCSKSYNTSSSSSNGGRRKHNSKHGGSSSKRHSGRSHHHQKRSMSFDVASDTPYPSTEYAQRSLSNSEMPERHRKGIYVEPLWNPILRREVLLHPRSNGRSHPSTNSCVRQKSQHANTSDTSIDSKGDSPSHNPRKIVSYVDNDAFESVGNRHLPLSARSSSSTLTYNDPDSGIQGMDTETFYTPSPRSDRASKNSSSHEVKAGASATQEDIYNDDFASFASMGLNLSEDELAALRQLDISESELMYLLENAAGDSGLADSHESCSTLQYGTRRGNTNFSNDSRASNARRGSNKHPLHDSAYQSNEQSTEAINQSRSGSIVVSPTQPNAGDGNGSTESLHQLSRMLLQQRIDDSTVTSQLEQAAMKLATLNSQYTKESMAVRESENTWDSSIRQIDQPSLNGTVSFLFHNAPCLSTNPSRTRPFIGRMLSIIDDEGEHESLGSPVDVIMLRGEEDDLLEGSDNHADVADEQFTIAATSLVADSGDTSFHQRLSSSNSLRQSPLSNPASRASPIGSNAIAGDFLVHSPLCGGVSTSSVSFERTSPSPHVTNISTPLIQSPRIRSPGSMASPAKTPPGPTSPCWSRSPNSSPVPQTNTKITRLLRMSRVPQVPIKDEETRVTNRATSLQVYRQISSPVHIPNPRSYSANMATERSLPALRVIGRSSPLPADMENSPVLLITPKASATGVEQPSDAEALLDEKLNHDFRNELSQTPDDYLRDGYASCTSFGQRIETYDGLKQDMCELDTLGSRSTTPSDLSEILMIAYDDVKFELGDKNMFTEDESVTEV